MSHRKRLEDRIAQFAPNEVRDVLFARVFERGSKCIKLDELQIVLQTLNYRRRLQRRLEAKQSRPREPKETCLDMAERQAIEAMEKIE